MALHRFEKLSADRRHRVIAAAAMEFAAKGYEGATLEAITESVGMGKTSVYYYFADKADLCSTVLEEAWRRLRFEGHVDLETLTTETFWPTFETLARESLALCHREPWLLAASKLLNWAPHDPASHGVLDQYVQRRQDWEAAFISRGQELGVIRIDAPVGLLLAIYVEANQAANHWLLAHMDELGLEESSRLGVLAFDIYRGLLVPPSKEPLRRMGRKMSGSAEPPVPNSRPARTVSSEARRAPSGLRPTRAVGTSGPRRRRR
jgi:AcrR family transcriptional regulator